MLTQKIVSIVAMAVGLLIAPVLAQNGERTCIGGAISCEYPKGMQLTSLAFATSPTARIKYTDRLIQDAARSSARVSLAPTELPATARMARRTTPTPVPAASPSPRLLVANLARPREGSDVYRARRVLDWNFFVSVMSFSAAFGRVSG